jgi:hypothetical protein
MPPKYRLSWINCSTTGQWHERIGLSWKEAQKRMARLSPQTEAKIEEETEDEYD